ncbi:MAG TPA: Smr/MutS family protein [Candidatus Binatia bacterium]|nr:Smr/MutS family protein [Candidatus Binatia bacterium]
MKDDDDSALFRDAMRGVRPLAHDRLGPARPPPSARPLQKEADERAVLEEMMTGPPIDSGDELSWKSEGVQDAALRKLKRGAIHVDDELDLHGLTADEARLEVARFVVAAQDRGLRCVRVIHGKGLRSKGPGPVLKQRLDGWLRRSREVLAYCSARREDGGTGAVYVLLRNK